MMCNDDQQVICQQEDPERYTDCQATDLDVREINLIVDQLLVMTRPQVD